MLIELIGGPYDGTILERSRRPEVFVWFGKELRLKRQPAEGLSLYRMERASKQGAVIFLYYRHAEFEVVRCSGCGWMRPKTGECPLCKAAAA